MCSGRFVAARGAAAVSGNRATVSIGIPRSTPPSRDFSFFLPLFSPSCFLLLLPLFARTISLYSYSRYIAPSLSLYFARPPVNLSDFLIISFSRYYFRLFPLLQLLFSFHEYCRSCCFFLSLATVFPFIISVSRYELSKDARVRVCLAAFGSLD